MRRGLASIFLVWGVGTVVVAGVNVARGNLPLGGLAGALVAGAVLLTIAWWLDRSAKKRPQRRGPNEGPGP